jgi:hypothetical protein
MYVPSALVRYDRIYQGDVFEEFPCPILASTDFTFMRMEGESARTYSESELPGGWQDEESIVIPAQRFKIVVLSQSCDIHEEGKLNLRLAEQQEYDNPFILYGPLIPFDKLAINTPQKRDLRLQKPLRAFYFPSHPDGLFPESAVVFNWICTISKSRINRFSTFDPKRKLAELASPHREALGSKLGYSLSRVGLPSDVTFIA